MGYSMTTGEGLRFTAWVDFDSVRNVTPWTTTGLQCGFELYNHTIDPLENNNLAGDVDHEATVTTLFAQLRAGWRATAAALPRSLVEPVSTTAYE